MAIIRFIRPEDIPSLYAVSLATGLGGGDASHLYAGPKMIGHIYAAPYAVLEPKMALVVQDTKGIAGYVVGAIDTALWESRLEVHWWPDLRQRYLDPLGISFETWSPDERRASMIHHPERTPSWVTDRYPAHLHLNLLPSVQGKGLANRLFAQWLKLAVEHGAEGVHVGVNPANERGIRFWARNGFTPLQSEVPNGVRTVWMGRETRRRV